VLSVSRERPVPAAATGKSVDYDGSAIRVTFD
jgi:hypothetical protein